jgi:hypothetical protein
MWSNPPIRPFRFNPKLDKEQQGQASFVEITAVFVPERDVFEFRHCAQDHLSLPLDP